MIPDIKKILYATDLTEDTTSYGFSYAVGMAQRYNASIVILHAIERGHSLSYAGSSVEAMMRDIKKQEQETSLGEVKTRIAEFCRKTEIMMNTSCEGLVSKIMIPFGNPVEEILKAADEEGCDMMILGTHKTGILTRTFLGSVAVSVLERTKIAVLFIPLPSGSTNIDGNNI